MYGQPIDKIQIKLREIISKIINVYGRLSGFDVYIGSRVVLHYYGDASSLDDKELDVICHEMAAHITGN